MKGLGQSKNHALLLPPPEIVWRKGIPFPDVRFLLDKNDNCVVTTEASTGNSASHPHIPSLQFDVRLRASCHSHDGGLNAGVMDPWTRRQFLGAHEDTTLNKHSEHFRQPVDAASEKRLNSYYQVITEPIDLAIIRKKLESPDVYSKVSEYQDDMELMFSNCTRFFASSDDPIHKACKKLKKSYEKQQEKIRVRMIKRNRLAVMMETREFLSLQSRHDPTTILAVEAGACRWYDFK